MTPNVSLFRPVHELYLICLHYLSQVYLCCKTLILGDELMPSGRYVRAMSFSRDGRLNSLLHFRGNYMVVGILHLYCADRLLWRVITSFALHFFIFSFVWVTTER